MANLSSSSMTANNSPSPYVVSSNYSPDRVGNEPYRAFDGDTGTFFQIDISQKTTFPQWLKVDLGVGNGGVATSFDITQFGSTFSYKDYQFQGSNDDSSYSTITSGTFTDDSSLHTITFSNSTSYRYYRLYCTTSYLTTDCPAIKELVIKGTRGGGNFFILTAR